MPQIQILDEHLTNMIAAGEVVERPANIVKECVENAIDAHATAIEIEVFEGGIEGIVITDNGCGMDEEDAKLAFMRHATSKLKREEDLFAISTMGFRGEALASISAVAKCDLLTNNGQTTTHVKYEYGQLITCEPSSAPRGTRIEVRGLFVKTPARFKYLRKPPYEFSVIADLVNKMAISYPNIRFKLSHNSKVSFQTSGNGNIKEVIYQLYGKEVAQSAQAFCAENNDFSISGFAVQPKINRATKYFMFISINHRLVRSTQIQNAILDAYKEYLPPNRYPIVIMDIEVDPQLVDVNVHPNKWEVRISKQADLVALIHETISATFTKNLRTVEVHAATTNRKESAAPINYPTNTGIRPSLPQKEVNIYHTERKSEQSYEKSQPNLISREAIEGSPNLRSFVQNNHEIQQSYNQSHHIQKVEQEYDQPKVTFDVKEILPVYESQAKEQEEKSAASYYEQPVLDLYEEAEADEKNKGKDFFSHLHIIGQLRLSYILCENEEGLVIIDQHAAQERYHFEQICEKLKVPCTQKQARMVPLSFNVSQKIMALMEVINQECAFFGIEFEAFGNNQLIVRELPLWFDGLDESAFLQDLLDLFEEKEKVDMESLRRHMMATAACHSSIRFNRKLTMSEMEHVIEDLKKCGQPYHCPHGRPTVITLSDKELRKEFERG
jgi:DNA mismatch repair protein MutL